MAGIEVVLGAAEEGDLSLSGDDHRGAGDAGEGERLRGAQLRPRGEERGGHRGPVAHASIVAADRDLSDADMSAKLLVRRNGSGVASPRTGSSVPGSTYRRGRGKRVGLGSKTTDLRQGVRLVQESGDEVLCNRRDRRS